MDKRQYTSDPEPYMARTIELVQCLSYEPQLLQALLNRGRPYDELIGFITSLDAKSISMLKIVHIARNLGKSPVRIAQWVRAAYSDLWQLNFEEPELFRTAGVRYDLNFILASNGGSSSFTCWLQGHIGLHNQFEWPFVQGRFGVCRFYVTDIQHRMSGGSLETTVYLTHRSAKGDEYLDRI